MTLSKPRKTFVRLSQALPLKILDYNYLRHREALLHMKATPTLTTHHLDHLEGGVPAFPPSLLRSLPSSLPFLPASEQRMCLGE